MHVVAVRFAATTAAIATRLPFGLSRVVPPVFVGFALISGFAFAVDLGVVTLVHGGLGQPVAVAVVVGYAVALLLGFALNKLVNFGSHAPVGPEAARYAAVVVANLVLLSAGVTLLVDVGVQYQLSRVLVGLLEGAFMYAALRLFVFKNPSTA